MTEFTMPLQSAEECKANASIGPYFGYRFDVTGSFRIGFKFIVFGGATIIEVFNDSGDTSNVAGLSYGAELIVSVKRSFQFGIVAGEDRVSKSENFDLNGKPWIAFAFDYNFTN